MDLQDGRRDARHAHPHIHDLPFTHLPIEVTASKPALGLRIEGEVSGRNALIIHAPFEWLWSAIIATEITVKAKMCDGNLAGYHGHDAEER